MADNNGFSPTSSFGKAVQAAGMMNLDVPEDKYNEFRESYFNSRIAPRLQPNERQKQRENFLQRTQRPKMPLNQYIATLAEIPGAQMAATLDKTVGLVSPTMRKRGERLQADVDIKQQQLDWHGKHGGGVAGFIGGGTAYGLETVSAEKIFAGAGAIPGVAAKYGKYVGPLLKQFPRLVPAAGRMLTFGALTAAEAEPGKRKDGFATGIGWGIAGELAGAAIGGLWKYYKGRKQLPSPKQVDDFLKEMARGEPATTQVAQDLDHALAESIQQEAKQPGYLKSLSVVVNEKLTNPMVTFVDKEGHERVSGLSTKNIEKGYAQVKEAIDNGFVLTKLEHSDIDAAYVNELMAKLKQNYEPWSPIPSQIATDATNKGIDAGGGTARVDNRVLKFRYASAQPPKEEARRFIKAAIDYPATTSTNVMKDRYDSRVQGLMQDFETVWNPFANWMQRSEAATKLEGMGLTDIIPIPEVRAKWKPAEGMNLPQIFNERGWFEALDRWKGRTAEGAETRLDIRQKDHLTNSMKVVWDPAVPHNSTMFRSALRVITQYELDSFVPGSLSREEIGALLTEARAGTETAGKAVQALEEARRRPAAPVREHLYQQISRLADTFAKNQNVDEGKYVQQYGRQTVDAAKSMAAMMWERSKGNLLEVKMDEDMIRQGIREGILPPVDPSGKPLGAWFSEGEAHLAEQFGIDNVSSLRKASLDSQVMRLAEQFNVDPKNIDRELLEEVGEVEVARAKEIADAARKSGVSVYDQSVMEEMARLGKFSDDEPFMPRQTPHSERPQLFPGEPAGLPTRQIWLPEGQLAKFGYSVKRAASGLPSRIYVSFDDVAAKGLKFSGQHIRNLEGLPPQVQRDLKALAQMNGIELEKAPITLVHRLTKGFTRELSAPMVWHEDTHGMLSQIGISRSKDSLKNSIGVIGKVLTEVRAALPENLAKTWDDLGRAVASKYPGLYKEGLLPEEAFTHAATAIRYNDSATIAHMAAVDTDVEHVFQAVQSIAGGLRKVAAEMAPGSSKNFIMDRLGFLENISNVDRYKAVREAAEQAFAEAAGDAREILINGELKRFGGVRGVFDSVEDSLEGRLFAPNYTAWAEVAGVRQALYPTQMPPGKLPPPMPEMGPENWHKEGAALVWSTFAPAQSWVNWVDKELNAKWAAKGQNLPVADRFKAVEEAFRAGGAWLEENRKSAVEFLNAGKSKLESYGLFMTKDQKEWPKYIRDFNFDNDDLTRIKLAHNFLKNFQADTGIPVFNYFLQDYPKLATRGFNPEFAYGKADPAQMSTFHRLIASGELNPRDLHLGRFINVMLREGMEKKFTGEALKGLREVINKRGEDGKYVLGNLRLPLQRYHDYFKGIPDVSGRALNSLASNVGEGINSVIRNVNRHLPKGYQVSELETGHGDFFRRFILLNYVANIGGRAAIAVRDSAQVLVTSMPIVGMKTLVKGAALAMKKENWEFATKAGVPLKGQNIGDVFGDIFQELPKTNNFDKALGYASQLLAPSRWGHNIARRMLFAGVYDDALPAVKNFRKASLKWDEKALSSPQVQKFLNDSGLWFADEARQRQILSLANDKYVPHSEVAKQIALEMNDLTLWAYRRGTQPGFLMTGAGRIFGQYGLWPMNYVDYVRRLVSKIPENPKKALSALGMFAAVNYGLIEGGQKYFGVDVSKWFGLSPMGYAGSPHLQFAMDVAKAPEDTNEGRAARKRVMEYPFQFMPASNELRTLREVWDKPMLDENGGLTQDAWRALGFRIYKPGGPSIDQVVSGDIDVDKYLDYETGGGASEYKKWYQEFDE